MTVKLRVIKTPSKGALDILRSRLGVGTKELPEPVSAVGLVQGQMIDMVCAADIAEKADGVTALDIRGSCPQNMVMLAIFGDTASVEDAVGKIEAALENYQADRRY